MTAVRLATRRSALALAQSRLVADRISRLTGRPVDLVPVVTRGDRDPDPLAQIGGTGVFVTAVRAAVVEGLADLAVHSLKDLPTAPEPLLAQIAIPAREDPRDALVSRTGASLAELPQGSRVGTGSPRRRVQLAAVRPDLRVVDMRGNVDSRLARVAGSPDSVGDQGLDAVVLAAAGLARLGRRGTICQYLDPEVMVPAPGQGALAVEVRSDVANTAPGEDCLTDALRALDDPGTRAAVTAERSLLAVLEAGCSAPVGALAQVTEGSGATMHLRAVVARPDGSLVRASIAGPAGEAAQIGRRLADQLRAELAPAISGGRST